jgi:hypothetical protein
MALYTVQRWCERTDLSINPDKMVIVLFTRKRTIKNLREPTLFTKTIQFSDDVKYLGLILDKGLTWKGQLAKVINKASKVFWACRVMFGKTWGLRPHIVYWIYMAVIRPIITYSITVWWPRVKLKTSKAELSKLQRLACLSITGASRTTPTAALEIHLGLPLARAGIY